MKAVHFGAGNIGRGFIGQILNANGFSVDFVDINETVINALNERQSYTIEYADDDHATYSIDHVDGINNGTHPEKVIAAIEEADIVTTAIGPNILPFIAELIAKGIQNRRKNNNHQPFDVIACENMIGGTAFLHQEVDKYLDQKDYDFVDQYVGFPNAAVDRIVPMQSHEDVLFVTVEPFCEWVVDETQIKSPIRLKGVHYVDQLEAYIERKLFTVNTGHATVAYTGSSLGHKTIDEAMRDERVANQVQAVLNETGALIIDKWGFDQSAHQAYQQEVLERFKNPHISDDLSRVARTPIRKLGHDERFIRPIREAKARGLGYQHLLEVVGLIFGYNDPTDDQSVELQELLAEESIRDVVKQVTQLQDEELIDQIIDQIEKEA